MLNTLMFAVFGLYWCQGSPGVKVPLGNLEVLYIQLGLCKFFPPRAVTMGCYKYRVVHKNSIALAEIMGEIGHIVYLKPVNYPVNFSSSYCARCCLQKFTEIPNNYRKQCKYKPWTLVTSRKSKWSKVKTPASPRLTFSPGLAWSGYVARRFLGSDSRFPVFVGRKGSSWPILTRRAYQKSDLFGFWTTSPLFCYYFPGPGMLITDTDPLSPTVSVLTWVSNTQTERKILGILLTNSSPPPYAYTSPSL